MKNYTATINCNKYLHFRPSLIVKHICELFPHTEFMIIKKKDSDHKNHTNIDPKNFSQLTMAYLSDGEDVTIQVNGESEAFSGLLIKAVLERNSEILGVEDSESTENITKNLLGVFNDVAKDIVDPNRHIVLSRLTSTVLSHVPVDPFFDVVEEKETVSTVLGGRLHGASVEVLPMIAEYYNCKVVIKFENRKNRWQKFNISAQNPMVKHDLLCFSPVVGTPIMIEAVGERRSDCCRRLAGILAHLSKADFWIRKAFHDTIDKKKIVMSLEYDIDKYTENEKLFDLETHLDVVSLSEIIKKEMVVIGDTDLTKYSAIESLSRIHGKNANISIAEIEKEALRRENLYCTYFSYNTAIPHARLLECPLMTLSVGIFPKGIVWGRNGEIAYFVFLVVSSSDAPNTHSQYLGLICEILRESTVREKLINSTSPEDVVKCLKQAESRIRTLL